jgi:hypothetical protein
LAQRRKQLGIVVRRLPAKVEDVYAGHTDIFPKNLFWYHLLTALAYKTPRPIIDEDLIGNTKGIT